jgi:hypothetical protein
MKLKGKPILLRTVIGEVEHKGKVYQVTIEELGEDENDFEIWELSEGSPRFSEEIDPDSDLGKKLVEFFLIETEDIEQFL